MTMATNYGNNHVSLDDTWV